MSTCDGSPLHARSPLHVDALQPPAFVHQSLLVVALEFPELLLVVKPQRLPVPLWPCNPQLQPRRATPEDTHGLITPDEEP